MTTPVIESRERRSKSIVLLSLKVGRFLLMREKKKEASRFLAGGRNRTSIPWAGVGAWEFRGEGGKECPLHRGTL